MRHERPVAGSDFNRRCVHVLRAEACEVGIDAAVVRSISDHLHRLPTVYDKRIARELGPWRPVVSQGADNVPGCAGLEQCNGVTSATPEFPNGVYHYVLLTAANSRRPSGA